MRLLIVGVFLACSNLISNNIFASTLYIADEDAIYFLNQENQVSIFKQGINPSIVNVDNNNTLNYWDYLGHSLYSISTSGLVSSILSLPGAAISGYTFDVAGNLYLADISIRTIYKYNDSGALLWRKSTGTIGAGIAIDNNGYLYVGGVGDHKVHIFDLDGNSLSRSIDAGSSNPMPHYVDENNNLYATSPSDGKVIRATYSGGQHSNFVEFASGVWWANDVVIDENDLVYAVSTYPVDSGIFVFDIDGALQKKISSTLFDYPRSIVFGPDIVAVSEPPTLLLFSGLLMPYLIALNRKMKNGVLDLVRTRSEVTRGARGNSGGQISHSTAAVTCDT